MKSYHSQSGIPWGPVHLSGDPEGSWDAISFFLGDITTPGLCPVSALGMPETAAASELPCGVKMLHATHVVAFGPGNLSWDLPPKQAQHMHQTPHVQSEGLRVLHT